VERIGGDPEAYVGSHVGRLGSLRLADHWRTASEKRIGQHITGVMRDAGGIEWSFGRKRGLGL